MSPRLPSSTVQAIEAALHEAIKRNEKPKCKAIAAIFHTTYATICYHHRKLLFIIAIGEDHRKTPGRRRIITPDIEQAVQQLLAIDPAMHQKKVAEFISQEFGVKISQPRISELMQRLGQPRKKTKTVVREQTQLQAPSVASSSGNA